MLWHFIWQITIHTTWTVVSRMHTCTGNCLVAVHQIFALTERIQNDSHRANVQRMSTDPQQVIQ